MLHLLDDINQLRGSSFRKTYLKFWVVHPKANIVRLETSTEYVIGKEDTISITTSKRQTLSHLVPPLTAKWILSEQPENEETNQETKILISNLPIKAINLLHQKAANATPKISTLFSQTTPR